MFGLDAFSTCSQSGVNTLRQIHLSWKIWRAALLSAASNFPHLPVVLLTTPATLPRSKAVLRRRQESSGEQRCAHRPGGGEQSILKGARRFQRTRRLVVSVRNISLSSPVAPRNGKKPTFNNRCVQLSSFFFLLRYVLLPDFTLNRLPLISLKIVLLGKNTAVRLWSQCLRTCLYRS